MFLLKILFGVYFVMCYSYICTSLMFSLHFHLYTYRLLDSLMVECWHRVRDVPGSIPSQGPRHTKDVIKMVQVVPLFGTQH